MKIPVHVIVYIIPAGAVKSKATINYEVLTDFIYDISISVSDGTDSDTETLQISIENVNEPPTFNLGTYSLYGNEGVVSAVQMYK